MEHDLKKLIVDLLDTISDADLLDLVYKVLLESVEAPQGPDTPSLIP